MVTVCSVCVLCVQDFVTRHTGHLLHWVGLSDWRTGRWEWINRTPYIMERRYKLTDDVRSPFEEAVQDVITLWLVLFPGAGCRGSPTAGPVTASVAETKTVLTCTTDV